MALVDKGFLGLPDSFKGGFVHFGAPLHHGIHLLNPTAKGRAAFRIGINLVIVQIMDRHAKS